MYETDNPIDELVHLYQDGAFSRRELVRRVAKYTGGIAAAAAAVNSLALPAKADDSCPEDVRVPADASDLFAQSVEFPGAASTLFGYLVMPRDMPDSPPAILVIHENRGLVEHIKDVTRRAARAGFVALGIDLLSRQGGTDKFTDPTDQTRAYNNTTPAGRLEDMQSAVGYLKGQTFVQADRIGVVGFCAGGGNVYMLAVNSPDVKAAVPFYGAAPNPIEMLDQLNGAIMPIYAELDRTLTAAGASVLTRLVQSRKTFGMHVYQGVGHAFHNDTGPAYNRGAACDAWSKATAFFTTYLKG